jgi:hypothetical protein
MGNFGSMNKINFEDVQHAIETPYSPYYIISTLPANQICLIRNTIPQDSEEVLINDLLQKKQLTSNIIIYGLNDCDETVINKYKQLQKYGFRNIYVYLGGMFEWMLLQDIYGESQFPTTHKQVDILKFKPRSKLQMKLITAF